MGPLEVVLVSGAFTMVGSLLAWWLARRDKREQRVYEVMTPSPPSTQEVWNRLDKVERVLGSTVVLLGEAADQWPHDHEPVFSKRHVLIVAEAGYMPPEWDPQVE